MDELTKRIWLSVLSLCAFGVSLFTAIMSLLFPETVWIMPFVTFGYVLVFAWRVTAWSAFDDDK